MEPKPHKTYREQVALLVDRGMLIDDEDAAMALLRRVGYYTLSGYSYPFRFKDSTGVRTGRFRPGTSLTQVEAIWEFDNRLRARSDRFSTSKPTFARCSGTVSARSTQ